MVGLTLSAAAFFAAIDLTAALPELVQPPAARLAWRMTEMVLRLNKGKVAGGGGLSSRCIMGETGEWLLVAGDRTLDLDASLVPLYRKMAAAADRAAGVG